MSELPLYTLLPNLPILPVDFVVRSAKLFLKPDSFKKKFFELIFKTGVQPGCKQGKNHPKRCPPISLPKRAKLAGEDSAASFLSRSTNVSAVERIWHK